MKMDNNTIKGHVLNWRNRVLPWFASIPSPTEEPPLRAELFSIEQMERYGRQLAETHHLSQTQTSDHLLDRLADNEAVLVECSRILTTTVNNNRRLTPAGEWLLDNFYLIDEQIRTAKRHLPRGYSRELPRLSNASPTHAPRVYALALEIVAHGDGRVDPALLNRFISAYQEVVPLKLGELWAIPIMLRLALIENLRRIAARLSTDRFDQELAAYWTNQMLAMAESDPKNLVMVVADMARSNPPLTSAFVAEFARRLQSQSTALTLALNWLEQFLSESNVTIEHMVQQEAQQQAADQVSIGNTIGSLRFLVAMDWREFVENMSVVEQTLRQDPHGTYTRMDFATRDQYRHQIEKLAKKTTQTEYAIAQHALALAQGAPAQPASDARVSHVGYYLFDHGLAQLKRAAAIHPSVKDKLLILVRRLPLGVYVGSIALFTLTFTALILSIGLKAYPSLVLVVVLSLSLVLATSHLAVGLVNWLATLWVKPRPLPRLDFSQGVPEQAQTLVVIPTMLSSVAAIEHLVEMLEVRFLANRQPNIVFGLLTDFKDAPSETLANDQALIEAATTGINQLNAKYPQAEGNIFYLFHRPRRWNAQEHCWMGYERKRGKLADLNALLRGKAPAHTFSTVVGDIDKLLTIQYVITLDTDTQLPRDAAYQLIGTMAHPLNQALYDTQRQRVTQGYGILQPRVGISIAGANTSRYARLHSLDSGIDPYTHAVSDVYQDIFAEGSFIGKGIYAVDCFEQSLAERLPENRILSHDLLEGCLARAGLISDVMLYEDYPARYSADIARRHRWIRGDWQIAQWLYPTIPTLEGKAPNNLSALSRWKIFDNLRRSLVPLALVSVLLIAWLGLSSTWLWTLAVLGILLFPALSAHVLNALRKPADILLRQHLFAETRAVGAHLRQALLVLTCLPYEAYVNADAIVRTLWRLTVSQQHLLEWVPSSDVSQQQSTTQVAAWRNMWLAPTVALITFSYLVLARVEVLPWAMPILFLWFLSPSITWWLSQPIASTSVALDAEQNLFLRLTARRTWSFFETLVSAEDHWLPPDNYQEYAQIGVAHRTSPTNIGLSLLANLAAYDFGYIPSGILIERTTQTFRSLMQLERYRGHFYNWYDTQSLQPLKPLYVSTVDSGNLVGHLLTLQTGLLQIIDQPIISVRWFEGLQDSLQLLIDTTAGDAPNALLQCQQHLTAIRHIQPFTIAAANQCLEQVAQQLEQVSAQLDPSNNEQQRWYQLVNKDCRALRDELHFLLPHGLWETSAQLTLPFEPSTIPTLRQLVNLPVCRERILARIETLELLARQAEELSSIQYDFLYDKARHLFAIGYNVSERHRDTSCYDLLASEARLSTFIAIAQQQIPQESWFALGRLLVTTDGEPTLLSWSGSMFEYLMPLLVMPTYPHTLLDQTYQAVVQRQIAYGQQRDVPWGISESGYSAYDAQLNYQYRAFGVPGLGLKRGLAEDLVIAPYSSVLALMVNPEAAYHNLKRLTEAGFVGRFGFYEAIDYTVSRQRRGEKHIVIQSYMAHHQGMSLLALAYVLLNQPMQQRFAANPLLQATLLLLEERVPKVAAIHTQATEVAEVLLATSTAELPIRVLTNPDTDQPQVQLLSNGRYHVMLTHAGGGYSRYKDMAITRWQADTTRDHWGAFCYIRHLASGAFWSTAYQPTLKRARNYEAIFSEGRAEFRRSDHGFDTHWDIVVSPEDDIELRRLRITNRTRLRRTIDVTSYAEVVLAPAIADDLHPAFSKLFVQTEILDPLQTILCHRRPRDKHEKPLWLFHSMTLHEGQSNGVSYETDRAQFIGRGRQLETPQALVDLGHLSGSEGAVLDPIVAIRHRLTIEPETTVTLDIVMGVAESREASVALAEKYRDQRMADRVFDLAWTHNQVVLRQLNANESEAQLYAQLANAVLYSHASLRAEPSIIASNQRAQSALWAHAISGDLPIVLLQIKSFASIELVRQLIKTHAYWRLKGLSVDLVIWNEDRDIYRQSLQEQILGLVAWSVEAHVLDRPGGIFIRQADYLSREDRILIQSVARVILSDTQGTLEEQLNRLNLAETRIPRLKTQRSINNIETLASELLPRNDLVLFNGLGGFTADGREYVMLLPPDKTPPAPWVNILANPFFGSVVSEAGQAYTWVENAHEHRLTPWYNDPVTDNSGEAFYIRDEESGHFWSPTPLPCRGTGSYISRHGFGYSVFEHNEAGIYSEMTVFVALDAPVKCTLLRLRNHTAQTKQLAVTGYVEWVLGDLRTKTSPYVVTDYTPNDNGLVARNLYSMEFASRMAFFEVSEKLSSLTADRTEFIGRNGSLQRPAALLRTGLSGKTGAALDPCAALQVMLTLAPGQERDVVFTLGSGYSVDDANYLIQRFRSTQSAYEALHKVQDYWLQTLSTMQLYTPDAALNVLGNGWLIYQTLACRFWGRSGYYQSGGAFGFRDQLQDSMALVHAEPSLVRAHLLLCAGHQFQEGDVQHWWHPPLDRGVRTRCSDDYLWLPLATCRYVQVTGDWGVLDEIAPFLQGRALNPDEESYYDLPTRAEQGGTLYEHCVRAIGYGLRFGTHGLPLMGSGDWNDGMNLVGIEGKGESIWLGFFLCEVLQQFGAIAQQRQNHTFADTCQQERQRLVQALEAHAWDGAWYRRAYFDDGTPLGSQSNDECQIDSLAQSWSVLTGVGSSIRTTQALSALNEHLVKRDAGLIQLLDPPFDHSALDPGYIKGYVPGVRENGGQYTHAAVWATMAYAQIGERERAWELMTMLNPVNHALTMEQIARYKVEPYVVCADIYAVAPHTGRGGWTWYTGSASWMYRLITESLLGLRRQGTQLTFKPCLPAHWSTYSLHYRYYATLYQITVQQVDTLDQTMKLYLDNTEQPQALIELNNDQGEHQVQVMLKRT